MLETPIMVVLVIAAIVAVLWWVYRWLTSRANVAKLSDLGEQVLSLASQFNITLREPSSADHRGPKPLVMPLVHLRSMSWSHTSCRRPARSTIKNGRHANQRCQYMFDGRTLVGIVLQ